MSSAADTQRGIFLVVAAMACFSAADTVTCGASRESNDDHSH